MALTVTGFFLPPIQPYRGAPPETEFFLGGEKKTKDDLFLGGIERGLERREIGVEEAGEKVPVGQADVNCGLYFCGEFLMV